MKKTGLLSILPLLLFLFAGKSTAQTLVCNDLIYFSLDEDCSHTIVPDEILEGFLFSDCIVELDKTAPYGNGPWVAPVLEATDIGKTYQVRVRHVPSGNSCWGSVKVEDKLAPVLDCSGVSTVNLNGNGDPISVSALSLSIIAADNCSPVTLSPATLQYDCADLGMNVATLTATDASGNISTCQHSVLVANSTNCQTCLSHCPPSVVVSFESGHNDLLPAFQNSDWAAFDGFGDAFFEVACMATDSIYDIQYEAGTIGQSWFSRNWLWVDASAQIVHCEQLIIFPTTHTVGVEGKIFLDTDNDCNAGAGEQGVAQFHLLLTKLPSGLSETIYPESDGTYQADIEFGAQDLSAQLQLILPSNVNPGCVSAIDIPNSSLTPTYNFDIGLQTEGNCPLMQVDIGNLFTRRCATNSFTVDYCNIGLDTAVGAFVTVNLDPLISLETASLPYTVAGPDSVYTFQLGDIPPFQCGSILIRAKVSCEAILGQTLCNEANAYPDVPCNGMWQGAEVAAKAYCSGDSVSLVLWNEGPENMTIPHNYIVVEDFIMYKNGSFQLNVGDSLTVKVPANGSTWRIETNQSSGFPLTGLVSAAIEGCGGLNTPGIINVYAPSASGVSSALDCSEVVGSFDPNDKTAIPVGYSDAHLIRANEVIEYKIRFQNTGTDTAFRVVVVDTLSSLLDAGTLVLGSSSHPYRLDVYPGGILHFVFFPILLPDSIANEAASHGFLTFKIAQQPDLPDGTRIENTVAIYFDQNDPVLTNTAFHTIGYPFAPNAPLSSTVQTLPPSCHGSTDGAIEVAATGGGAPYSIAWGNPNLQGLSVTGLPAGSYQFTLTDSHGDSSAQSVELTQPEDIVVTLTASPTIGNEQNGSATSFVSGGTGPYAYLWNNGMTTQSLSGLSAGTYTLVVTDENGCTKSESTVVEQVVGTASPGALSRIAAWPNPAHDYIMLNLEKGLPDLLRLHVLGADGRVLRQVEARDLSPVHTLYLGNERPSGFVLLVFYGLDGSMATKKIVLR